MSFSKDFVWGTASSAYQIEGAYDEDGRGLSIWDVFCHDGRAVNNQTGDVACDHYHRWEEDLDILADLKVKAYRFSVSWSRVIPNGIGEVNPKGIAFYNRLIDGLLKRGITPYLTLYHWDMPQELFLKGGFMNPDFPQWFEEYTRVIRDNYADRVKHFFTFNEPQCIFHWGHNSTAHAPGMKYTQREQLQAVHNMLKAHGLAVRALHEKEGVQVGYAGCGAVPCPSTKDEREYELAKEKFFSLGDNPVGSVVLYSDPIMLGKYPDEYYQRFADIMPKITQEDMELISTPVDYFAQNSYKGYPMGFDAQGNFVRLDLEVGAPKTAMGWDIYEDGLYYMPKYLYDRYKTPVYISENGAAFEDLIDHEGKIRDSSRQEFIRRYIGAVKRTVEDGTPVLGYFYWSFLDNFEWRQGYGPRFGLVHVDYTSLERRKKESFYYYKTIIEKNGEDCFL